MRQQRASSRLAKAPKVLTATVAGGRRGWNCVRQADLNKVCCSMVDNRGAQRYQRLRSGATHPGCQRWYNRGGNTVEKEGRGWMHMAARTAARQKEEGL